MTQRLKDLDRLVFAVGLEDTAIGSPVRGGGVPLDEYELTGHTQQWQQDVARVEATGASALRYGFPWYRVNPAPGVFDWSWTDQVVADLARRKDLKVILDLVHYGTPTWLHGSFVDPDFPEAISDYARAIAERYRGYIAAYTPLNEPLVTASFCGLRGVWPPYLHGDEGWASVIVSVVTGIQSVVRAIRQVDQDAEIVHVEAVQLYTTRDASLEDEVHHWERRAQLPTRLLLGQVGPSDWGWSWLRRHGIDEVLLERLRAGAEYPDVLGLNYYPDLSGRELARLDGTAVHVTVDGGTVDLEAELRRCHSDYGLPLMVTETSVEGDPGKKCAWIDDLVESLLDLRDDGLPVIGLTWWPLVDFVDWSWASGGLAVEEFYHRDDPEQPPRPLSPPGTPGGPVVPFLRRMGIYSLEADPVGGLQRKATPLLDVFRSHASASRPPSSRGGSFRHA